MKDMQEDTYPKKTKISVAGQFAAVKDRSETYRWTLKLNREDYGEDKYWVKNIFSRMRFEISRLRLRFLVVCDLPMTTSLVKTEMKREYHNLLPAVCAH